MSDFLALAGENVSPVLARTVGTYPEASRTRKRPSDQEVSEWGGEDSNLRPADYESAALTH
jgi:hypothetical protein